jgi:hypothetical protein
MFKFIHFFYEDFRANAPLIISFVIQLRRLPGYASLFISSILLQRLPGYAPMFKFIHFFYEDYRATPLWVISFVILLRRLPGYASLFISSIILLPRFQGYAPMFKFIHFFYEDFRATPLWLYHLLFNYEDYGANAPLFISSGILLRRLRGYAPLGYIIRYSITKIEGLPPFLGTGWFIVFVRVDQHPFHLFEYFLLQKFLSCDQIYFCQ